MQLRSTFLHAGGSLWRRVRVASVVRSAVRGGQRRGGGALGRREGMSASKLGEAEGKPLTKRISSLERLGDYMDHQPLSVIRQARQFKQAEGS